MKLTWRGAITALTVYGALRFANDLDGLWNTLMGQGTQIGIAVLLMVVVAIAAISTGLVVGSFLVWLWEKEFDDD